MLITAGSYTVDPIGFVDPRVKPLLSVATQSAVDAKSRGGILVCLVTNRVILFFLVTDGFYSVNCIRVIFYAFC